MALNYTFPEKPTFQENSFTKDVGFMNKHNKNIIERIAIYALTFILSLMAIFSTAIYASTGVEAQTPSSWARESVERARSMNLIPVTGGYQQATTRAEFAAFAVRLYQNQNGPITGYNRNRFTDTSDSYVARAAHIGLINGVTDTTFAPHRAITRQEAATLLHRVALALGDTTDVRPAMFGDIGSVPSWARDGINWASSTNPVVMGGVGGNIFNPTGAYTREQTAVSLVRVYDVANGNGVVAPPVAPIPTPTNTPVPPPTRNEWVYVLGNAHAQDGMAGVSTIMQEHDGRMFMIHSGHADRRRPIGVMNNERIYELTTTGINSDGAQREWPAWPPTDYFMGTAFANTEYGVVSVLDDAFVSRQSDRGVIRARVSDARVGPAFVYFSIDESGPQKFEIYIWEAGNLLRDVNYTVVDARLAIWGGFLRGGLSGAPLLQEQNGEIKWVGSHRGGRDDMALANNAPVFMPEFHRQIALYQQRQPTRRADVAPSVGGVGAANQPAVNVPAQVPANGRRVVGRVAVKAKLRDTSHSSC